MPEGHDGPPGRRERELFEALTQAADVAGISVSVSYLTESGSDIAYTNDVALRLLGVTREELTARSVWSFIAEDERPRLLEMHAGVRRGEAIPSSFSTVMVASNGRRIPVEIATHRVILEGRPANVTFLTDVSHRRHAEDALRRSEGLFRSLAESAPDGIAILRFPTIVYVNRRAADLLRLPSVDEAIGRNLLDFLIPEHADTAQERARRRSGGEVLSDTVEYTVKGTTRSIEVSATAIEYEGKPATLGFARDITERKLLVARLMQSEKLAALGTLAAGVAHEVNNPLAYLLLSLDMLERQLPKLERDPSLLPSLMKLVADAKHGGARVKTIVRDLQTFTRRDDETGGPLRLDAAIDAALSIASHELRQVTSVLKKFEDAPAVLGNATRFEQLFLNLVLNAIHAIEGLPPERRVIELSVSSGAHDTVIASVRDHGKGMDEETRARVFEPFFTTKPLGMGTGLGLSICQGIAHSAGGELSVKSVVGQGTTVTLTLPAYRGSRPVTPRPFPVVLPHEPRRATLLVVDDERAIAASLAEALADEHDITTCGSVAEARALLRAGARFELVLCDVVMPGEEGPALLAYLRQEHPALASRFVFMTGGASLPIAERLRAETECPQIEKPFELASLRALIQQMLDDELSSG